MTKKENIMDVLTRIGLKSCLDEDGDISFYYQLKCVYIIVSDDDEPYATLLYPHLYDIDEGEETLVLATCNKMTRELKLCKVYVDPSFKHVSSGFEFYYANDEALELNLRQSLNILGKVKTLFRQNMEMLGQDCEE